MNARSVSSTYIEQLARQIQCHRGRPSSVSWRRAPSEKDVNRAHLPCHPSPPPSSRVGRQDDMDKCCSAVVDGDSTGLGSHRSGGLVEIARVVC